VPAGPAGGRPARRDGPSARAAGLIAVAEDLAGELSLRALLERILVHATGLLHGDAGSVCSVDEAAGTYRKEADIGVACQSGQVFPLTEGMTGVARRAPAWFRWYDHVPGGHVARPSGPRCAGSSACHWSGAAASSAPACPGSGSCTAGCAMTAAMSH
jgi:hypothetical protein